VIYHSWNGSKTCLANKLDLSVHRIKDSSLWLRQYGWFINIDTSLTVLNENKTLKCTKNADDLPEMQALHTPEKGGSSVKDEQV
jgi:hypothetical protein